LLINWLTRGPVVIFIWRILFYLFIYLFCKWRDSVTKLIGKLCFREFVVRFKLRSWMSSELSKDWLEVVWNRRPRILLRKWGLLVLDAFNLFSGMPGNVPGLSFLPILFYPGSFPFSICAQCVHAWNIPGPILFMLK